MEYYIAIDDTDNKESRGTGYHARQLGHLLSQKKLAIISGITRHQLFVHPDIPYTSQNSSAAIHIITSDIDSCIGLSRKFLLEIAPAGSDIGLACSSIHKISKEVVNWGMDAKAKVLNQQGARQRAKQGNIFLEGLTGTKDGIIGALAALGLRKSGNDGRFVWLKGNIELRDFSEGIVSIKQIIKALPIEQFVCINSQKKITPESDHRINLNKWIRPVLKDNKVTLLIEKANDTDEYEWKNASKDSVRAVS